MDHLTEQVIQKINGTKEETVVGIREAFTKEHPENTKILIFDREFWDTSLLVYAYSAESISYPYPDPVLVTEIDLLGQISRLPRIVKAEQIPLAQRYFTHFFTECFFEAGGESYPFPCFLCDGAVDYYYLQEKRWLGITEMF